VVEGNLACQGLMDECAKCPDVYCCGVGLQHVRRYVAQGHGVR
jgi:hypothetical protein